MSGCYGNHPEDRHFEALLHDYLEEHDMNDSTPQEEESPDVEELQLQIKHLTHQHKNDEAAAKMLSFSLKEVAKERDALKSEREELLKRKPVAWASLKTNQFSTIPCEGMETKLYCDAMPLAVSDA